MRTAPPDPALLLEHADFLRRLARGLVGEEGADDVLQETWVAALSRPPAQPERLRGWLARVARNAALLRRRTRARRERRERRAARPEAVPSHEEILDRESLRRRLIAAVLRLDGASRDVLLLRYYEGLPPREIARRLGLAVETVRTRTRRAVARLRDQLDGGPGGRSAWRAAVLPFAVARPRVPWLGVALMTSKAKSAVLAVVLALALAGAGWVALRDPAPGGDAPHAEGGGGATPADASPQPRLAGRPGAGAAEPAPDAAPAEGSRDGRGKGVVRGIVRSGATHRALAGVRVAVRPTLGASPDGMEAPPPATYEATADTDGAGRFVLEGLPLGAHEVLATHPTEGEARGVATSAVDSPWLRLYVLPGRPEDRVLRVRVLDPKRRPVTAATVGCVTRTGAAPSRAATDADGWAAFGPFEPGAAPIRGWVTATASDGAARRPFEFDVRYAQAGGLAVDLVLEPAGAIRGRVRGPEGVSVEGTVVEAWSVGERLDMPTVGVAHAATVAPDGAFALDALPAGPYVLWVRSASGLRLDAPEREGAGGDFAPVVVPVEAGRTAEATLAVVAGGSVRGRVVRAGSGSPVAGARVLLVLPQGQGDHPDRVRRGGVPLWRLDGPWPEDQRHPMNHRALKTDAAGRYAADGLLPGEWRIAVAPQDGLAFDRREPVTVRDGDTAEVVHELAAAGTLELAAKAVASLGLRRPGARTLHVALITPVGTSGALVVPGLAEGRWELVAVHSDETIEPVVLAECSIEAGRTTYLDATNLGNSSIRFRLLDRGAPVAGALVTSGDLGWTALETDREGRAAWSVVSWRGPTRAEVAVVLPGGLAPPLRTTLEASEREVELPVPLGALTVRATDASGSPASGAEVSLRPAQATGTPRWSLGPDGATRPADGTGAAAWSHVPPGSYEVEVTFAAGVARAAVRVDSDPVEIEVRAPATGGLRIVVRSEAGDPAAGVAVGVRVLPVGADPGPGDPQRWRRALDLTRNGWKTDATGAFRVEGVPEGLASVGAWRLEPGAWTATANASAEVVVRAGEETEVVLRLRPAR